MSAHTENLALSAILERRGISLPLDDINTLRRAQLTLHRWSELECGDGRGCIERDEFSGIPQWRYADDAGKYYGRPIPDREKGALRRVREVCARNNLHFYHQSDPRGCALYVHTEPMPDFDYTRGVAVCA